MTVCSCLTLRVLHGAAVVFQGMFSSFWDLSWKISFCLVTLFSWQREKEQRIWQKHLSPWSFCPLLVNWTSTQNSLAQASHMRPQVWHQEERKNTTLTEGLYKLHSNKQSIKSPYRFRVWIVENKKKIHHHLIKNKSIPIPCYLCPSTECYSQTEAILLPLHFQMISWSCIKYFWSTY